MDMTKCAAALFDFDGVVMDTESQYSIFWNEVGEEVSSRTRGVRKNHQGTDFEPDLRPLFCRNGKRAGRDNRGAEPF